jgi:hypothetical protein
VGEPSAAHRHRRPADDAGDKGPAAARGVTDPTLMAPTSTSITLHADYSTSE